MESNRQLLARHERTRQTVFENSGPSAIIVLVLLDDRIAELKRVIAKESLGNKLRVHQAAMDSDDDTLVIASAEIIARTIVESGTAAPSLSTNN